MFKFIFLLFLPIFLLSKANIYISSIEKQLSTVTFNKYTNGSFIRVNDDDYYSTEAIKEIFRYNIKTNPINGININEKFIYLIILDLGKYTDVVYISTSTFNKLKDFLHLP